MMYRYFSVSLLACCQIFAAESVGLDPKSRQGRVVTPDGTLLTPAGVQVTLEGIRAQALALSPDGKRLAVSGIQPGIVVLNPADGAELQRVPLPAEEDVAPQPPSEDYLRPDRRAKVSFTGLLYSEDGKRVYLSNANGSIKVLTVDEEGKLKPSHTIPLPPAAAPGRKQEIPAGLALNAEGTRLYVALNLSNQAAEIDTASGQVLRTWKCGSAPYDVRLHAGKVYVSNWGGRQADGSTPQALAGRGTVVRVTPATQVAAEGSLSIIDLGANVVTELVTGRHASGLALSPDGRWLCVACANDDFVDVLDTAQGKFTARVFTKTTPESLFGAAPNAMTFSPDGRWLYVCNGSQNAVAVLEWKGGAPTLAGLMPVGWFPGAIAWSSAYNTICVGNVKGLGAPLQAAEDEAAGQGYNSYQYMGTVTLAPASEGETLAKQTAQVMENLHVPRLAEALAPARSGMAPVPVPQRAGEPSVFKNVIYIIKENRTYDQVLGDMKEGRGSEPLCIFGEKVTPNQHRLARDFVLLDNTYCSGILSADGHIWTLGSISTDYVEKQFGGFPRSYPDGSTRENADALAWPPAGFLWDTAVAAGLKVRMFGEFAEARRAWKDPARKDPPLFAAIWKDYLEHKGGPGSLIALSAVPTTNSVAPLLNTDFPAYDNDVPDQIRADVFLRELAAWEQAGSMPQLVIISLPGDHTSGTRPLRPTPRAHVADHDLAYGRIVEAVSRSSFWKNTCILGIEDDPQAGWDHVSAYRTTAFVSSAWSRKRGTVSTLYNQNSLLRTIELILGLKPMSLYDATATPLRECFGAEPDFAPWSALPASWPLDEMNPLISRITNPRQWRDAQVSSWLPFEKLDACPEDILNGILWRSVRGDEPYPHWAMLGSAWEDD